MKLYVKIPILCSFFMSSTIFGKRIRQDNWVLPLLYISFLSTMLTAQEDAPGRIPVYPVPYEYPTIDGIKEVLNRVRVYYESTSTLKIVDSETGEEITDFTKLNKNARVSSGLIVIPVKDAFRLLEKAPDGQVLIVPGGEHASLEPFEPYMTDMVAFLDRYLRA